MKEVVFIEEKTYQKIKEKIGKKSDCFSKKELRKLIDNINKT